MEVERLAATILAFWIVSRSRLTVRFCFAWDLTLLIASSLITHNTCTTYLACRQGALTVFVSVATRSLVTTWLPSISAET